MRQLKGRVPVTISGERSDLKPCMSRSYLTSKRLFSDKSGTWRFLGSRSFFTDRSSILKSRQITLSTKVHIVKAMVFPVVMYGWESWTIRKAEHWRINAFELWCWRRLLRVTWIARRSNQYILKEISPEYSLEGLMLKLQYFGYWWVELTHWKKPWCWKRVKAGGEGNNRRWDGWMGSPTWWTWVWASSRSWWQIGRAWHATVHGVTKSWTRLSD